MRSAVFADAFEMGHGGVRRSVIDMTIDITEPMAP